MDKWRPWLWIALGLSIMAGGYCVLGLIFSVTMGPFGGPAVWIEDAIRLGRATRLAGIYIGGVLIFGAMGVIAFSLILAPSVKKFWHRFFKGSLTTK